MKTLYLGVGVLLAAVLWLHVDTQSHAGETSEREYWYSSDPDTALVVARFAGGRSAYIHRHAIFADGRYEYQLTDLSGQRVFKKHEVQLASEEVTALLDRAVHAGLMEFDRDIIEERKRAIHPPYIASDAGTMFLEINLERYRGPGQPEAKARSHSMSLKDAYFQAQVFTSIEEIQALKDIGRTLEDFQHRAGDEHAP